MIGGYVDWIAANADGQDPPQKEEPKRGAIVPRCAKQAKVEICYSDSWEQLSIHNFPAGLGQDDPLDRNPDLWLYRDRTVSLLRRYLRFSLETGRLPSMVSREFFRAKMSSYRAATFEDRVIFVRDVEKCLSRLEYWDQQLIARVILQEYSHVQAAHLLHCCRKTLERRLSEVLDLMSEDFLKVGLLTPIPTKRRHESK